MRLSNEIKWNNLKLKKLDKIKSIIQFKQIFTSKFYHNYYNSYNPNALMLLNMAHKVIKIPSDNVNFPSAIMMIDSFFDFVVENIIIF